MNKKGAIILAETEWYKHRYMSYEGIVQVQLYEEHLMLPFSEFQKAIQEVLGRPVYTHEFASSNIEKLQKEFEQKISCNKTKTEARE